MAVCIGSHRRLGDQPQLDDGDRLGYLATSAGLSVLVPGFIVKCSWPFTERERGGAFELVARSLIRSVAAHSGP